METTVYQSNIKKKYISSISPCMDLLISSILDDDDDDDDDNKHKQDEITLW